MTQTFFLDVWGYQSSVESWLAEFSSQLEAVCHVEAEAAWNASLQINPANQKQLQAAQKFKQGKQFYSVFLLLLIKCCSAVLFNLILFAAQLMLPLNKTKKSLRRRHAIYTQVPTTCYNGYILAEIFRYGFFISFPSLQRTMATKLVQESRGFEQGSAQRERRQDNLAHVQRSSIRRATLQVRQVLKVAKFFLSQKNRLTTIKPTQKSNNKSSFMF